MKKIGLALMVAAVSAIAADEPLRVALMDFDNQASAVADVAIVGGVSPKTLAEKGVPALGAVLANDPSYVLIDRRDFVNQIQAIKMTDNDQPTATKTSFLKAAQAVNADVVLRGSLLMFCRCL